MHIAAYIFPLLQRNHCTLRHIFEKVTYLLTYRESVLGYSILFTAVFTVNNLLGLKYALEGGCRRFLSFHMLCLLFKSLQPHQHELNDNNL